MPSSPYYVIYLWWETERENHGWSLLGVAYWPRYCFSSLCSPEPAEPAEPAKPAEPTESAEPPESAEPETKPTAESQWNDDVIHLTESTFQEFIETHNSALIMFYAPCKSGWECLKIWMLSRYCFFLMFILSNHGKQFIAKIVVLYQDFLYSRLKLSSILLLVLSTVSMTNNCALLLFLLLWERDLIKP